MASYFLAPIGNDSPFFLSTGVAASGAKLFTYTAGSTNKANTYQDNAGNTLNANPILLNSSGYPASGGSVVEIWLISGTSYKFVLAPSTDSDPPNSPYWTRDNISGVNDVVATASEWQAGPTPTFVSATQFTLVGDQTGTFQVGRRVKTTNTAGTIYSTITVSAFTSLTTVTVVNDSGTLDSGLSAVSYGLLSSTNNSIPQLSTTPFRIVDASDFTKKLALNISAFTTATTRTWTIGDASITVKQGSCTLTLTGCTTSPTVTAVYSITNNVVTMFIPAVTATSNTTACTFTGLPAEVTPATTHQFLPAVTEDNGATGTSAVDVNSTNIITLKTGTGTAITATFTNTGVKGLPSGATLTYNLN